MNFRGAVVEDLEDLVAVQEAAAVVGLGHIFPQEEYPFPREAVLQRWVGELADPTTEVYVCTDETRRITGFAARREDELLHLGTALHMWGTGLATQLHDALLATFPNTVTRCRLRVFAENRRARRFYEKVGLVLHGRGNAFDLSAIRRTRHLHTQASPRAANASRRVSSDICWMHGQHRTGYLLNPAMVHRDAPAGRPDFLLGAP